MTTPSPPTPADPAVAAAVEAVQHGVRAASAYERDDLAARLEAVLRRLREPSVNVVVVGEFKQGKSSFINALLNSRVCPVDDDIATAVPTSIRHAAERRVVAVVRPVGADPERPPERREIPFDEIGDLATERHHDPDVQVVGVEVGLQRDVLESGLVLVDTPGVGGLGSAHATAALGALSVADAAVFVSDASQEYTATEIDFLRQATEMCPHVVAVMTKTDFYPAWRRVRELDDAHLRAHGFDVEILPVSSALRIEAIRRGDESLERESGFPAVRQRILDDVVGGATTRELTAARSELTQVVDQLISGFESERSALDDPEARAALTQELEAATARCELLRGAAARWSTTLNDGIADLTSDVDHDIRQRIRTVLAECDAAIDNSDPLETWAEFEPWLANRVAHEVVTNFRFLNERSEQLRETVHQHFELAGGDALQRVDIAGPMGALSRVSTTASVDLSETTTGAKGMTVLRGSYSGILMFTMLGSMIGVALGPIALGVGLAMGRKGLREEKQRQLQQRRAQAKTTVRKYTDEVSFQVNKDSRDTLRNVQRTIRDFYTARAEELHRSTNEALTAARDAARRDEAERTSRLRDVDAELERLRRLRERAVAVPTSPGGPAPRPREGR